jgi:hypothetical protein
MTFRKLNAKTDMLRPKDHWITVTSGMSGWFAVEMWMNDEEPKLGAFPEPWDTGLGRYRTEDEARVEAICWAHEQQMPWSLPLSEEQAAAILAGVGRKEEPK